MDFSLTDLDEFFRRWDEQRAARQLAGENPYARDLIRVLWPHPKGRRRLLVIESIWELRNPKGLNMPIAFEHTVQSAFNQHNSESAVFQKSGRGPEEALFYPVGRKGSGIWAVRQDRAYAWMQSRGLGAP
jgi:hypothetical protein